MKSLVIIIAWFAALQLRAQTNVIDEPAFRSEDGKRVTRIIDPELRTLVGNITTQWKAGQTNAADITAYLKSYDDLLAKHKGEKTEAVAQILYSKENFYSDLLCDCDNGDALLHQLAREYPDTELGRGIGEIVKRDEPKTEKPPPQEPAGAGKP